jgi:signal transduction histidine kinase/CheY-like chemotaxis protein
MPRRYNPHTMRESLFHRAAQPAGGAQDPRAEALDVRIDLMRGLLIPIVALGWLGMSYALAIGPARPDWPSALAFGAVLAVGIACIALNWSSHPRAALWTCALALWGVATANYLAGPTGFGLLWVGVGSVVAALLGGMRTGWLTVALTSAGLVWRAGLSVGGLAPADAAPSLASLAALMLVTHILSRVLFQTFRWMSQGYATAHQQADQLRAQTAQLEAALKSLGQTSFALARANEQLEIMVRYAEDARRSKQEFAANISHELRTPLNLIIGFSDIILNAPATYNLRRLPPGLLSDIHVIHHNAQHLLKLVNDILDLSQMDVAYMTIAREPVRLDGFIQAALHDFAQLIESRGLALDIRIDPGLPDIYADKTRIRQVLLNLVNNALRFTDRGGITVRASAATDQSPIPNLQSPISVIITVADTGVGIAPADLERIFEPFTKIERPNRPQGGTGLGLTISKRFVELHGGRMWVDSQPGVGSAFHFTLPVVPPPPDAVTQGALRAVRRKEVGALAVVEPSPLLSRLLERHLRGLSVLPATSFDDLLRLPAEEAPEAILVNQPPGAPLPDPRSLGALASLPLVACYVPDVLGARAGIPPAGGDAGPPEAIRRYLIKPVTRDGLHGVLREMLAAPAGPPGGRPARILVVEDDEEALRLLGRLLRAAPPDVRQGFGAVLPVEMRSGEQALAFLRDAADAEPSAERRVDGMLLDVKLEGISGLEVLREVDRHPRLRGIPACVVSGQETPADALVSPYLTFVSRQGLPARELAAAIAALMQIALPGLDLDAR